MNPKKSFGFVLFSLLSACVLLSEGWAQPKAKPVTVSPVILHSFAVDRGCYGYIWKIYLEAEDPDGDMLRIASVVNHTGYGHYPTDWIFLKPQYQKRFRGYIQWNTFSSRARHLREWTRVALKVSVMDKAGNESNEVVFPFSFETGAKDQYRYKLPRPFSEEDPPRIGYIHIDLVESNTF